MIGPGKYDNEATAAREATGAAGVLLIVIGGERGNGFSCQATQFDIVLRLPALLRTVADQIEADQKEGKL